MPSGGRRFIDPLGQRLVPLAQATSPLAEGTRRGAPDPSILRIESFPLHPKEYPMRKLKLDVEELQVDSFETRPARVRRGTVAAHLMDVMYEDPFEEWDGGGGGGYTVGTCIGPTFCCAPTWNCPETWNCPVINTNTASRVMSAILNPCTCTG
jgi:hypothetical protein